MNIVIVNHYAGGPSIGMEFRPYYLAKEWLKKGHRVIVIGASFSHLRNEQPTISKIVNEESIDGVDYIWIKTNQYSGNGIGRLFSMFLFCWRLRFRITKVLTKFKPDLIIASSTYTLDIFAINSLAKKYGISFGYEVHDLWPLSPMELGGYSKYNPFMILLQLGENLGYRNAAFVVSMLPKTLDHMISHGLEVNKFCFIPNGISLNEWNEDTKPEMHITFINKLKKVNKFIVGYVGGHAISNALDTLIQSAVIVENEISEIVFILVGKGTEKDRLMKMASSKGLRNIYFLDPVPKKTIPALLSTIDVLYLGWQNNPLYRFGISPNKLVDYMMAGKPIVHSVNAGNDLVKESGCGISVLPEDPIAISKALKHLYGLNNTERLEIGLRGREFITKNYDYEVLAEKFITFARSRC